MHSEIFDNPEPGMDYSTEPEVIFSPLSPERYCEFYDIEMDDFTADIDFYLNSLAEGMDILEVGCGSGRLSRALASSGLQVTGIDISLQMLNRAACGKRHNINYVCMDMIRIAFKKHFDAVIAAYNTMNILSDSSQIRRCLNCMHWHLKKGGLLLLQIFLPPEGVVADGKARTFQFQIFDTKNGGKVIKETLKYYTKGRRHMVVEERYRIRPMNSRGKNEDLAHSMNLPVLSYSDWTQLLTDTGFVITEQYGDFKLTPFVEGESSHLLLKAQTR